MQLTLGWQDVVLRLALALIAGAAIGFNREERSQGAGLRTTVLVCLAACLAMVLANLLLDTSGKDSSKFSQIDVLRLPLGVLSGIGFIGAGAIIKRGDSVAGVATAATIWFMTIVGTCIGAGYLVLGAGATAVGFVLLWALRWIDLTMPRKFRGSLKVAVQRQGLAEDDLRRRIEAADHRIVTWGVSYEDGAQRYEVRAELEWQGREADRSREPEMVKGLADDPAVLRADWDPAPTNG